MKQTITLLVLLYALLFTSCQKQLDWLDVKPTRAQLIPTKIADFQAILDGDDQYMNFGYPYLSQLCADDIFVSFTTFQSATADQQNIHIWGKDIFQLSSNNDWNIPYTMVEYANICLDGLTSINRTLENAAAWDNVRGSALFFRSLAFFMLAQEFTMPYNPATAANELGIPIRLSSDVNIKSVRSTLKQTYDRITADLEESTSLLPNFPAWQTRPSKVAAEALLARVYLTMQNYAKAGEYANKVLTKVSELLDYNTLVSSASYPFPNYTTGNKEILFYAISANNTLSGSNALIDTVLYNSYATNDLRRTLFFRANGNYQSYRGSYTGRGAPFSGIALNEVYLIRAESRAREGNLSGALQDLNALLVKRWKTGTFIPLTAATANDALQKILAERRKELVMTGCFRWDDLRRLNQDPAFAKTLVRVINGKTYTLPPNDKRYALPIPEPEIQMSGIEQNPR